MPRKEHKMWTKKDSKESRDKLRRSKATVEDVVEEDVQLCDLDNI